MALTPFDIINYSLILVFIILLIRYIWITYISYDPRPADWRHALKEKRVSSRVRKLVAGYADSARSYHWWLQVERLRREGVPGVFVELGVYKGDSARILHALDPERPLHLFDTFSGFPSDDLNVETGEASTYTPEHFADTGVKLVLKRIGGTGNIEVHPGYFPASARGFREPIALANLDADLYNPTKAGLELFYPLVSRGGVIMVHDYNHKWPGIVKAVDEFVQTIPESMVLLPDRDGTAVIIRK
jgi:O-methyltransferase